MQHVKAPRTSVLHEEDTAKPYSSSVLGNCSVWSLLYQSLLNNKHKIYCFINNKYRNYSSFNHHLGLESSSINSQFHPMSLAQNPPPPRPTTFQLPTRVLSLPVPSWPVPALGFHHMDPDREWRPTSSTGLGWAGDKAEGNPTESLCRLLCTYPAVFSLKKKKLADWLRPEVTTWQLRASQRYHPKGGLSVSFVQCLHFEIEKFHISQGFPGGASGKEATCQCKRHKRCEFDP